MKKHYSLFLLPFLMLSSCSGSFNQEEFIATVCKELESIQQPTETTYTVLPEGNVIHFTQFREKLWKDVTFDVPTGEVTVEDGKVTADIGKSFALRLPILINKDNFTPADSSISVTNYSFGVLNYILGYKSDPIHFIDFKKEEGNFVFFIENVSKPLYIYNVDVPKGPSKPKEVKINARFNITATYNAKGLLIEEKVKTINADTDEKNRTVNFSVKYTYNA